MGGIVRAFTGPSKSETARKEQARADAARASATAARKREESETALKKGKKKRRTVGRRSTILTSPLGTTDTTSTQTLGQ